MKKNEVIIFDTREVRIAAEQYFTRICGLDREGEKFNRMRKDAAAIHEEILPEIVVKAIVRRVEASAFTQNEKTPEQLEMDGQVLHCRAFAKMTFDKVRRAYLYILTCGGIETKSSTIIHQFYADTWGTAYVDSARDKLYDIIRGNEKGYAVTPSFGPGYYGMDVAQGRNFFNLLDATAIGVRYHEGGIMLPVKSCVGVYFVQDETEEMDLSACAGCESQKGCRFCEIHLKKTT